MKAGQMYFCFSGLLGFNHSKNEIWMAFLGKSVKSATLVCTEDTMKPPLRVVMEKNGILFYNSNSLETSAFPVHIPNEYHTAQ